MTERRPSFRCHGCGAHAPRWVGRCASCGAWNSLHEVETSPRCGRTASPAGLRARSLRGVDVSAESVIPTRCSEVDEVLGGGLHPGSVTLVTGEPGIGKSTLTLQILRSVAARGHEVLLASAEEAEAQVRRRADRLGRVPEELLVVPTSSVEDVVSAAEGCSPVVLAVDSVQTIASGEIESAPGSVAQVGECLRRLAALAADRRLAVIVVGQVTKDGRLAGPRRLEHLVDAVLWLEGDRHGPLRFVRATKNRHGGTERLGVLEMGAEGLRPAPDPSRALLRQRRPVAGSVVVPMLGGGRPLLVELQALVPERAGRRGRLHANGLDAGRVAQLLATLDGVVSSRISDREVFVSTVGGVRAIEPAVDLGVVVSVVSALGGVPLPPDVVVLGEVGLTGALRAVAGFEARLACAARLGFRRAVVPACGAAAVALQGVHEVETLAGALAVVASLSRRVPRHGNGVPEVAPAGGAVREAAAPGPAPTSGAGQAGVVHVSGTMPGWWSTTAASL